MAIYLLFVWATQSKDVLQCGVLTPNHRQPPLRGIISGFSKLLVIAGYNLNDLNDAEIVDIGDEDGGECVVKTGYPHDVFGVAGALLDGTIKCDQICARFSHFGKNFKSFATLRVYLVLGGYFNLLWQKNYPIGQNFIIVNGEILDK